MVCNFILVFDIGNYKLRNTLLCFQWRRVITNSRSRLMIIKKKKGSVFKLNCTVAIRLDCVNFSIGGREYENC